MMAYMGAAVASELPSSSAYTTLQQQLQRSISTPASTYSSSAMSILQLTESPTAAAAAANSSLASFSDKFLLDSSCQDSPYTPHGSHATVTSACSSYQSDGSAALSGWQALDNMQQQQLANIAAQTSPPPAAVSLQLAVAGSSSCSSSEILGSTMMSSDWQQLLDSSCNRFRISSGTEGFTATTAGGHSNRLGGGNSAVRTAGGRRGGGGTTVGAGHSSCIDSKLLNLSTAPRRPWGSLEKASCGISVEPTKGALALQGVGLATSHCLEQFSSDPAFAERAAKFSSFSNNAGKYGSQIPQPLPFVTSASDHSGGKSRHAPRVGSCSAPSRAAAPQLADSESCKISSRSSCPAAVAAAGAAASGTPKIINLQTACTSSSLSQKLETANDPMQQDTQTETDQPRDTQDPDRQLAPLLVAPTDHHQDSAPVQKPELIIPPLQQQQQLEELETTGIVEAATDSDMIDVKELAAGHAGPTQEADFSSTSEQATCTTRAESSDDTARNKRKKQLHSETVKDQSHTTAAYFTESKLQQQVDDSASDQDSRAKRLKERRHAAAAAALEIHREDTMTMTTTTTTTTTTKSATFKDILASERSSSENSGDEPLSPGSTRLAGNKNKKNKQQQGTLHPSTMKNKVKVLQQQPPCSEPTTSCKQDYVHVRARRGQATDSHSLAERVRREKISERMKYLQDLVPGCTKVTGKAVMLDEIINYVQSLQQQVEFLSMKLASVNPPLDYNLDTILNRECPNLQMLQSGASSLLGLEPSSNYWLHQTPLIQQPITTDPEHFSSLGTIDAHHLRRTFSAPTRVPSASSVDAFGDDTTQISTGWDGELQSILQMGFAQTGRATSLLDGFNNCQLAAGHMKVEL